jgi:hypothetical protein
MNRFYTRNWALFFDYKRRTKDFQNEAYNFESWHLEESWFLFFKFYPKLFAVQSLYHSGYNIQCVVILGLCFGSGCGYDSRPQKAWAIDELNFGTF